MKNYNDLHGRYIPLNLNELRLIQLKHRHNQIPYLNHQSNVYFTVVAKIVRILSFQIIVKDKKNQLLLGIMSFPLKKSADLKLGKYYKFYFGSKKNFIVSQYKQNQFSLEIIAIKSLRSDQITIHEAQCLKQRFQMVMDYQKAVQQQRQNTKMHIQQNQKSLQCSDQNQIQNKSHQTVSNTSFFQYDQKTNQNIIDACKEFKSFDVNDIANHLKLDNLQALKTFLDYLADNAVIIDYGLTYQYIQGQQDQVQVALDRLSTH